MDCEQVLELVSAALDGELTPEQQRELEAHLSVCPHCRALAEDFRVLSVALDAAEAAPPPELSARVMARIAAEDKVTPISAGRRRGARRWLGLAAMLALVVCVGLWLRGAGGQETGMPMAFSSANSMPAPSCAPGDGEAADGIDVEAVEETYGGQAMDPDAPRIEKSCAPEPSGGGSPYAVTGAEPPSLEGTPGEPDTAPAPGAALEPSNYAFSNVQAVRVDGDAAADAPMARVLGSVEAAQDFAEDFPDSGLAEQLTAYDAGYFVANRLLAVVVTQEPGAVYDIGNVSYCLDPEPEDAEPVTKQVEVVCIPAQEGEEGSAAAWVLLAEVDAMFEPGEVLSVVIEGDG